MKPVGGKILFLHALLLFSIIAYTQNNTIDSLQKVLQTQKEDTNKVNVLLELCWAVDDSATTLQYSYARSALLLARKLNFKNQLLAIFCTVWRFTVKHNNIFMYKYNCKSIWLY